MANQRLREELEKRLTAVDRIREKMHDETMSASDFRDFVIMTFEPAEIKYEVMYEFSVFGYHVRNQIFVGNLTTITEDIYRERFTFMKELDMSNRRYGDLRAYCPANADEYPTFGSGEAEQGINFDLTQISVIQLDTGGELDYNNPVCVQLRENIGG